MDGQAIADVIGAVFDKSFASFTGWRNGKLESPGDSIDNEREFAVYST